MQVTPAKKDHHIAYRSVESKQSKNCLVVKSEIFTEHIIFRRLIIFFDFLKGIQMLPQVDDIYIKGKVIRLISRTEFDQIECAIYVPRMIRWIAKGSQYEWVKLRYYLTNIDKWNKWVRGATRITKLPEIIGNLIPTEKWPSQHTNPYMKMLLDREVSSD
jgi:hypothetical protein